MNLLDKPIGKMSEIEFDQALAMKDREQQHKQAEAFLFGALPGLFIIIIFLIVHLAIGG